MIAFDPDNCMDILGNTPSVLRTQLNGLSQSWIVNNYGKTTFSPFDIVGHLIQCERDDWLPRARIILKDGESRPFDPFDRYAMYQTSRGKTIEMLLDEFESLRRANLTELRTMELTEEQLSLRGTHPKLGAVTLRQLVAAWTVHDLHHIAQISKAMARQYTKDVGPWRAYLGILGPPQ